MEKENFHDGFENLFREKLENIEYPYSSSGWAGLQKGLRKQGLSKGSFISTSVVVSAIVVSVVVISAGIYFLQNNNIQTKKTDKVVVRTEIASQNNIINEAVDDTKSAITNVENSGSQSLKSVNCTKHSEHINNTTLESKKCVNEIVTAENVSEKQKNIVANELVQHSKVIPDAQFTFDVVEGCSPLKVKFMPNVKCDSIIYLWSFGDGGKSTEPNPTHVFEQSGKYNPTLTTKYYKSSAINTEISNVAITVNSSAIADFTNEAVKQNVTFRNMSSNYDKIEWNFGDSDNSILDIAEHKYKVDGNYNVRLIAYNNSGCNDTLLKKMQINIEHEYYVPTAFKPNGDSKNETFGPIGETLDLYQYEMYIYNRFNNLIFETKDVNIPWDGKIKGTNQMAETGVYVWIIITKDKFGNVKKRNGNVTLLNE